MIIIIHKIDNNIFQNNIIIKKKKLQKIKNVKNKNNIKNKIHNKIENLKGKIYKNIMFITKFLKFQTIKIKEL